MAMFAPLSASIGRASWPSRFVITRPLGATRLAVRRAFGPFQVGRPVHQPFHFLWHSALLPLVVVLILAPSLIYAAKPETSQDRSVKKLRKIVDQLRTRLLIQARVEVSIDERNQRLVSVEGGFKSADRYVLSFDREFLQSLDEEEIFAAIAHELGHIWISSHHPYLQTEALANQVAMSVVGRDILARLYHKVWSRLGADGDLEALLGPPHPDAEGSVEVTSIKTAGPQSSTQ